MEILPLVYLDSQKKIEISRTILNDRPLNDVRGLMISRTLELEIRGFPSSWIQAKQKATKADAELLRKRDASLYSKVRPFFNKTIWRLLKKGLTNDGHHPDQKIWFLGKNICGEWCEEACFRVPKEFPGRFIVDLSEAERYHIRPQWEECPFPLCRLVHRH